MSYQEICVGLVYAKKFEFFKYFSFWLLREVGLQLIAGAKSQGRHTVHCKKCRRTFRRTFKEFRPDVEKIKYH